MVAGLGQSVILSKRPFFPGFLPEIRAIGGEVVSLRKKIPQHFSENLLILLTLPR